MEKKKARQKMGQTKNDKKKTKRATKRQGSDKNVKKAKTKVILW